MPGAVLFQFPPPPPPVHTHTVTTKPRTASRFWCVVELKHKWMDAGQRRAIAVWDYLAREDGELSFHAGDIIKVVEENHMTGIT